MLGSKKGASGLQLKDVHKPWKGSNPHELEGRSRAELEKLLIELEQDGLQARLLAADEAGMKQFLQTLGLVSVGALIPLTLAGTPSIALTVLGSIGLVLLIFGFMLHRDAEQQLRVVARDWDHARVLRVLEREEPRRPG